MNLIKQLKRYLETASENDRKIDIERAKKLKNVGPKIDFLTDNINKK
jgi:hypothetical protein